MGLQGLVIGLGEAIVLHAAKRLLDHPPGHGLTQLARHPGRQGRLIGRFAVHIFGQDPDAAAGGDPQGFGDGPLGELRGDIHGRIAHAHHDDVLAAHIHRIEGIAVGVGVEGGAVEMAGKVRQARIPVVAVADEEDVIGPGLAGG